MVQQVDRKKVFLHQIDIAHVVVTSINKHEVNSQISVLLIRLPNNNVYDSSHTLKLISLKFNTTATIMSKVITVFGATGNQGGSVIKSILADPVLSKDFKVRGVTRNVTKESATNLESLGVEMVEVRS